MADEFLNIQPLCSFCYKKKKYGYFIDEKCKLCSCRNTNSVYVNAKNVKEFVRDFRNSGCVDRGTTVESCKHQNIENDYLHATENFGCSFASNDFEYFIWNHMKSAKIFKISEIFAKYVAPFVLTIRLIPSQISTSSIRQMDHRSWINPVPQSKLENEQIQKSEKRKIYFCWFCLKNVTSEPDIDVHIKGNDHILLYEADKKRRWFFKMPRSENVIICSKIECSCLSPHSDDEYREMKARIKFRNFKFQNINLELKELNPWPLTVEIIIPQFPNNIECYTKSLRVTVKLVLNEWRLSYIYLRGDGSLPFYSLYYDHINQVQKGQILKFYNCTSADFENFNFDIEFSPLCSGTYIQKVEFGFILHGQEYCSDKLIRVDVGTLKHLKEFTDICQKYDPILNRKLKFDNINPFSIRSATNNSILSETLLRRVFRVVSNLEWFNTQVEPWNYCDWMKDMLVHEELEQQFLLSQLLFVGDIKMANTFTRESFIPARSSQLFGTIRYRNDPNTSRIREFISKNVIKVYVLYMGLNKHLSLHECDTVDKFHYEVESRSMEDITFCFPNRAVRNLQLKPNTVHKNITVIFRFNRLRFESQQNGLHKMPTYDKLSYAPLCCPSFTRLPYGDDQSTVKFVPKLSLNEEQKRLPLLVLRKVASDEIVLPFVLNGAFGTGKTSVIAETVRTILNQISRDSRILICTRSYSAGIVYLEMFKVCLTDRYMAGVKLIASNKKDIDFKYNDYTIHSNSFSKEVFYRNKVFITSLDNVTYAMEAFSGSYNDEKPMFDYLFVDEAAQVLEIDAIMVYQFGSRKSKFIFAGDVFQVRPEFYNSRLRKFSLPITSRLHKMYAKNICTDYEICLKQVYRTHHLLVQYLSDAIYQECGLISNMIPVYKDLCPMKFRDSNIDCNIREEFHDTYGSFYNDQEIEMTLDGIEELLKKLPTSFSLQQILICTPFYAQLKLFREHLGARKLSLVNVELPTGIQGREFDVVFISTVLTINNSHKHPIHHPTFHNNKNLINLAISRAKHYVEVIGDKQCLLNNRCQEQWEMFLTFCGF